MEYPIKGMFDMWERATDLEICICETFGKTEGKKIIDRVRERHRRQNQRSYIDLLKEELSYQKRTRGIYEPK